VAQRAQDTDLTDSNRGKRLQRVMADAGVGSRRACETMIEDGLVEVNSILVTKLPAWVDPEDDHIVVDGKPLPKSERKLYIMLNKPVHTLSTAKDEPGADRRTVLELVDHPAAARLFPVGRLDYETVGLILLTNDGELANKLTHPRYGVPKTYKVTVKGELDEEAVKELERGIYLAQRKAGHTDGASRTSHVEIELLARDRDRTVVSLTLREGRNRQVRRMLAAVGYPVRKLERVGMGPVRLKGLPRGGWRELTRDEIRSLKKSAADSRKSDGAQKAGSDGKSRGKSGPVGASRQTGQSTGSRRSRKREQPKKAPYMSPTAGATTNLRNRTIKNAINRAGNEKGFVPKPIIEPEEDGSTNE
jgi:23S rRNA pseudouridine2605 synthase